MAFIFTHLKLVIDYIYFQNFTYVCISLIRQKISCIGEHFKLIALLLVIIFNKKI